MVVTTIDPIEEAAGRWNRLEESVGALRDRTVDLSQSRERNERELHEFDQRLRELESTTIRLGGQLDSALRQMEELAVLRDRLNRQSATMDEHQESAETGLRQVRQELDSQREVDGELQRRMGAGEKALSDLRDRLEVYDDGLRRLHSENADLAHNIAQLQNSVSTQAERITANTDGIRRASSANSGLESRADAMDRQLHTVGERIDLSLQGLRRVEETAEHWDDLRMQVESLRGRVEESINMLDSAKTMVAGVQRGFESIEERIGNVERMAEQLRARDARRERDVASLSDTIEGVSGQAAQDQDRFVLLQEQIRRRQIEALEQELRELKSFLRVRADD